MRKFIIVFLQILALTGCLAEKGFDTSPSLNPEKSPSDGIGESSCKIDAPSYGTQIVQDLVWSLSGGLSGFSFGIDHTRLRQFTTVGACGGIVYEVSLVNGNVTGRRSVKETQSYQFLKNWQSIGDRSTFVWSNLNAYPRKPVTFCVRSRSEDGSVVSTALCDVLYVVPDFTPPTEPSCVEYRLEQRAYLTSSAVNIWCKTGGSKDSEAMSISYRSAVFEGSIQVTNWQFTDGYIWISSMGLTPGRHYRLGIRAENSDKYVSTTRYYSFYLPAEVSISIKYKSKSSYGSSVRTCQNSGKTLDNFINNFSNLYPGCSLIQQSSSSYLIDCTSYQTCSSGVACSSLTYLTTNSDYTCGIWDMPVITATMY